LVAGFAYLLNPVGYAEFTLYPKLVIAGNIEQTVRNIDAHGGLFVAVILCYLINFIEGIIIAWALYVLLAPVNRALSLLTAWFRLLYTAIALVGVGQLVTAYRLVRNPAYVTAFGAGRLHADVQLLLDSFRYGWGFSLIVFGIHLVLLGYLIYRSGYIPKLIGILLVIDGLGWVINDLQPYLYPSLNVDFLFVTFFGEVIFMLWQLIMGWRIKGSDGPVLTET
jgi:Domain of unknown function (DUF4386)